MYIQYHLAFYVNTFTYAQRKCHKGGLTFREGNKDCFVMNKNVHSLFVLIFPFSVNFHKLSTVHVLCVNTLLEHLSALHGDSNTCGNGILFILSCKSLHMCALFQGSVAIFCYKAAKSCLPLIHGCHVCLLQPLAFSFLLLNDLVESAGCLHSHLLSYVCLSVS